MQRSIRNGLKLPGVPSSWVGGLLRTFLKVEGICLKLAQPASEQGSISKHVCMYVGMHAGRSPND